MESAEQPAQDNISDEMRLVAIMGEPRLSDEEKEALRRRANAIDETVRQCVQQILPVLKQASSLGNVV